MQDNTAASLVLGNIGVKPPARLGSAVRYSLCHFDSSTSQAHASDSILTAPACPRALGSRSPNMVLKYALPRTVSGCKVATLRASGPWTTSAAYETVVHACEAVSKTSKLRPIPIYRQIH